MNHSIGIHHVLWGRPGQPARHGLFEQMLKQRLMIQAFSKLCVRRDVTVYFERLAKFLPLGQVSYVAPGADALERCGRTWASLFNHLRVFTRAQRATLQLGNMSFVGQFVRRSRNM